MSSHTLRRRVATELVVLAALTALFLLLFPRRSLLIDGSLALVALALLAADARFTRRVVWAQFPAAVPQGAPRWRRCLLALLPPTGVLVFAFLVAGLMLGHRQGGWAEAWARVLKPGMVPAMAFYILWALLQQTLFQHYLLGRLRTLLPAPAAIVLTGTAYGLVHLPDPSLTAITAVAGIFWTWLYNRYRLLTPLAFSHAVLGTSFYYWVYGRDLAEVWTRLA